MASYGERWKMNFGLAADAVFEGLNKDIADVVNPSRHGEMFDALTAPLRIPPLLGYMAISAVAGAAYATTFTMPWNRAL